MNVREGLNFQPLLEHSVSRKAALRRGRVRLTVELILLDTCSRKSGDIYRANQLPTAISFVRCVLRNHLRHVDRHI